MPDTYTSQFSGEEIDSALRAAHIISGADTPAALREKLEIYGSNTALSPTDPTTVETALKYRTNPNLLDNWYFGRPVNQRGQVEYTGEWKYTIDRWEISEGTLTVNDGSISHSNGYLLQPFSDEFSALLKEKLITLSFLYANGSLESASATIPSTWGTWEGIIDHESIHLIGINNGNRLWVTNTGNTPLLAAKLELGSTQTLAHKEGDKWVLNEIPDFGEQLRRCTYYAEKIEDGNTPVITNATFIPAGATSATFVLPYERKRTPPLIRFNDVSNYRVVVRSMSGNTSAFGISNISILDVGTTKAAVLVTFSSATSQDWYGFLQRSDNTTGGYAFISADL